MNAEVGFAPIAGKDARVLVLGSMPGRRSLDEQQYYGNPHNAFWRIMTQFTHVDASSDYALKTAGLIRAQIAVWDVIKQCVRPGSLDADIQKASIEVNDFEVFLNDHRHIRAVFFNGARAAEEYQRRVLPRLTAQKAALPATRLLSTSPANARYSITQKNTNWAALLPFLQST